MKKKKIRLILRTVVLLVMVGAIVFALYNNLRKESTIISAGDVAPDFKLENLEGDLIQLSDYRGQGVFLNFWATYCKPCEEEMPYMQNQYEYFKDKGVTILAVDVGESILTVKPYIERKGLTFPVLLDRGEAVLDAYGVGSIPVTYLIDKDGIVIDRIPSGMTEEQIHNYMKRIQP